MIYIDKILEKIDYLPPFPLTVSKTLFLLKNPDVSAEEIAETIKFDQAVAANVLHLCNSSYFGLRRTVTNLHEALIYIGLVQLRKILILSGTRQFFETKKHGYESMKGELWRHSISTSIIADKFQKIISASTEDTVFISALLHDVGKLVLSEFVFEKAQEIRDLIDKKGITFFEAEKSVLSIDHAEIGSGILDKWNFSKEIVTAIRKHHSLLLEDDTDLDNIVRLSNIVSMMMGFGTAVDGFSHNGLSDICRLYDITHSTLDRIMSESLEEIRTVESEYGISKEVD
jgi:putative nucleotidyltransferase with HDIG domain